MDSMSKPLHAGHAAEAGVTAALAAREGVTGSLDVIEGEAGFGRAMGDGPDWDKALATLGQRLPHHAHDLQEPRLLRPHLRRDRRRARAAVAAGRRRARHRARRASAPTAPRSRWPHYEDPHTPAEARFSLKYVVATALTHGSVRLAAFEPARLARPGDARADAARRRGDRSRSSTRPSPASAPRACRSTRATAAAPSILQPTRKGDPDAPLSDAELDEKYLELAAPVIGEARRARAARAPLAAGAGSAGRVTLAQALFAPRAVALVGASGDATKNTARPQRYLRKHGYAGRIVADQRDPLARCSASAPTRASPRRRARSTTRSS